MAWTKPRGGGFLDRRVLVVALGLLQLVGELHHQDAVLGDEADQRHQADLGVDVDGAGAEVDRRVLGIVDRQAAMVGLMHHQELEPA